MKTVGIYIQDTYTSEYNRVDLFDDEKISVTSSIQNINDIAKTYTDFSQTFTVPASKQNNKIFKHWYDNANDSPFSTLVKANAYIEIDTIPFRNGKIQLESANVIDGQAQDYSITFIGILGNLKDTFAGKYLKDLTSTAYDFEYTAANVAHDIFGAAVSTDVMFPLITSGRRWNYGLGNVDDISLDTSPIRYNELFPTIRLRAVLNMIETEFGINFDGTVAEPSNFLSDARFTNAYLYLKNGDEFKYRSEPSLITYDNVSGTAPAVDFNLANDTFIFLTSSTTKYKAEIYIVPTVANIVYTLTLLKNDEVFISINATSIAGSQYYKFLDEYINTNASDVYKFVISSESSMTFNSTLLLSSRPFISYTTETITKNTNQTITVGDLAINKYFPEIKIEDFFSGLLKMFNLTCYSNDGINYTVEQLESYYDAGSDIDITKYVLQDKKALNRVKTYKRINFEYEKSESFVNVAFESNAGIPYGTLRYVNSPPTEGEEYSIKLPFEDLNFLNLGGLLQVGYCLKTDSQAYIPKPIILYDYSRDGLTNCPTVYFSNALIGNGSGYNQYKAFGQETLAYNTTYGLNFPPQQSTLTLEVIENGLYQQYYQQYFANIYNYKARLIKLSAILPTSVLTTLKLNDSIIIRDSKYLINTYTTDLTTGLVQFELLTDERVRLDKSLLLYLDAGNPLSYPGTGTLWTDLSGYGNNGTLINGPTFDSANGGSIVFDGVDDYANIINPSVLQSQNFSVSVWINPSAATNVITSLIDYDHASTLRQGWVIQSSDATTNRYYYLAYWDGTAFQPSAGASNIGVQTTNFIWQNLTYIKNGTSVIGYLNGVQLYTATASNATILYLPNRNLAIGKVISTIAGNRSYNGKVSTTQIYNRALSATEVLANYNATKGIYGL
jgi:hypothetical protein